MPAPRLETQFVCNIAARLIKTASTQDLHIVRRTPQGYILGDGGDGTVLLPTSDRPTTRAADGTIRVFVYRGQDGQQRATLKRPKAETDGLAMMKVIALNPREALVDWGLDDPLIVPHQHQRKPLQEGRWYVIRVVVDPLNDHPFGSTRHEDYLDNTALTVVDGDKVDVIVLDRSDMGYSLAVNGLHHGLVHHSDVFRPLSIGDRLAGYVRQIRPDNKLDITLQAIGYRSYNNTNVELLAKRLRTTGFLPLTDKSSAEEIYREFGISKKAFKQALGALYKERKIRLEEHGVVWVDR